MARLLLNGGAYQSRSLIAGAQRCINLYPEANPAESNPPVPVTHQLTPGLRALGTADEISAVRGLYPASTGDLFMVVGNRVEYVNSDLTKTQIGTLTGILRTPVSMADNGQVLVIVDGSANGWAINLANRAFAQINDPNFLGADRVEYVDTYFVFNRPGTGQFYISLSLVTFANLTAGTITSGQTYAAFDPLDIAGKTGSADAISTIVVNHGNIWLLGKQRGSEIWNNTGAADFTFGRQAGAFIEHGCVAKYSAASQDVSVFWLAQDLQGTGIIVRGSGYDVERVSTHAIEAAIQSYARTDDAIGFCSQQQGHAFYAITFPQADVTWLYELKTKQWSQWAYTDLNGNFHRHRANCCAYAYGLNIVGDWQNGNLYALDPSVYTDNGQPIVRLRSFPHQVRDGRRVSYDRFVMDMEVGTLPSQTAISGFTSAFSNAFGPAPQTLPAPEITLRYSDTRGATWSDPITRSLGKAGEYLTSPQWRRLGMGRDRVFEVSWSVPMKTALNGAFVDAQVHET